MTNVCLLGILIFIYNLMIIPNIHAAENVSIDSTLAQGVGHSEAYGIQLPIVHNMGIKGCAAVSVVGDLLYIAGFADGGSLFVADISNTRIPKVIGKVSGLGNVRQMVVQDGYAYVTTREDGLAIIDVHDSSKPEFVYRYDCVELATGVAISGNMVFVANRFAGVEAVDISNPRQPIHLSTIRVGEAQSVAVRDGIIYAGVWQTREMVVIDARNPRQMNRIGSIAMDGLGDGLVVRGNFCFAATGHHSRLAPTSFPKPGEPGFGMGHGIEIIDISNPREPAFVSRLKTPTLYSLGMDMWSVRLAGDYAFMADTFNGAFVIDISDPNKPRFKGHCQLPIVIPTGNNETVQGMASPVMGLAVVKDYIYLAGGRSDLHVVHAPGLADRETPEPDISPSIPVPTPELQDPKLKVFKPGHGQIHEVVRIGEDASGKTRLLLACGNDGIRVVDLIDDHFESVAHHPAEGIVFSIARHGELVFVAQGIEGLSIRRGTETLTPIGAYKVPGRSIKQVVLDEHARYALLQVGFGTLEILDVSDPTAPRLLMQDRRKGLFYRRPISHQLSDGKAFVTWNLDHPQIYDLSGINPPLKAIASYPSTIASRNGGAPFQDGWIATYSGKFIYIKHGDTRSPSQIGTMSFKDINLTGKPTVYGNVLFTSEAMTGIVNAVDVSDITQPRLLGSLDLSQGHPGFIIAHDRKALIPGGYQGLLLWDYTP